MAPPQAEIPFPDGYPYDLSDDDLTSTLRAMIEGWRFVSGSSDNLTRASGPVILAFIQLGLQELSRREVERATRAAQRSSRIALGIAIATAVAAVIFGVLDYFGDQSWQDDQTRLLTQIRDLLDP